MVQKNRAIRKAGLIAALLGLSAVPLEAGWAAPAVPPLPAPPPPPQQPAPAPAPRPAPVRAAPVPNHSQSLWDALLAGQLSIDARYRYEHVEQDGFSNDADAHTARIRAGYQVAVFSDLKAFAEVEAIGHINDSFNDTVNGKVTYPTVADPEDVQINRLQLDYSGIPQNVITLGRQRINLDNQRFIGAVGFRQNEQTFDAVRLSNTAIPGLTATYIYLNRVNRVFGEDSNQGAFTGDTHLINAGFDINGWGRLTGYGYLLDLDQTPGLSTQTFGVRFAGRHNIGEFGLLYAAEFARQSEFAGNPAGFDLDYWMLEGGIAAGAFKLFGGQESLEGDGTRGFSTPLATLHKFQGYADVFLTTPANGINDRYGTLAYERKVELGAISGVMAAVTYHDFEAERGGAALGTETDAELVVKIGKYWSTGVKYADYNGDSGIADRIKFWVPIEFTFTY